MSEYLYILVSVDLFGREHSYQDLYGLKVFLWFKFNQGFSDAVKSMKDVL